MALTQTAHRLWQAWINIGADDAESADKRLHRRLLLTLIPVILPAGVIWGTIYLIFGEPLPAIMPYVYTALTTISVLIYHVTHNFEAFRFRQLLFILVLPFLLMLSLGGFRSSGAVMLWSVLCPIGALVLDRPRTVVPWGAAYVALILVSLLLQPIRSGNNMPELVIDLFFALNLTAISSILLSMLYYFITQEDAAMQKVALEQQKSENLLLNILPKEIAAILKDSPRTIADHFDQASVMFADVVGFTRLTAELPAVEMVELLNEVFTYFDELVDRYGVEKIRTIGDSYMVVSGVPSRRPDHAHALAQMALDMQGWLQNRRAQGDWQLDFRIGINSGPLIAGVIGRKKFIYDLWGDSVNTASRMESHGEPGKIQITHETYELIRDEFECEYRGLVNVKGKGELRTYFVTARRIPLDATT